MKKLLTIFILLSFSIFNIHSQNKTIKGRVISDDLGKLVVEESNKIIDALAG